MNSRLAVIMVADLAGYSGLMEQDSAAAIAQVQRLRNVSLEPVVRAAGGHVEKRMGDGWLITFPSLPPAVSSARQIQQALAGEPGLKLRAAIHLGEIIEQDGELYGTGINIAARLQSQAPPGGIIMSAECHRQLDSSLTGGFADAGNLALKNVTEPVACFQWRPEQARTRADEVPVIAVAPITASPNSPEVLEAAADLKEQLVHVLSRRTGIRVLPLENDTDGPVDAHYLLRGRLRAHGTSARAILSMTRTDSNHVVWSETHESPGDDLFAFSDEVAGLTDNALRLQINAFDGERLSGIPDDELAPSELRSRAAQLFHTAEVAGYGHAEQLLDRAQALDPNNPTTLTMQIHATMWPSMARFEDLPEATAQRLLRGADEAVRLAPRSDFVFFSRAQARVFLLGDYEGGLKDVRRSLQINPNYVWSIDSRGQFELMQGKFGAAVQSFESAVTLSRSDPWLPRRLFFLALAKLMNGQPEDALGDATEAVDLQSARAAFWRLLAEIRHALNDDKGEADARAKAEAASDEPHMMIQDLRNPCRAADLIRKLADKSPR